MHGAGREEKGRRHTPAVSVCLLAFACLAIAGAGCSSLRPSGPRIDSAAGLYDKATVSYRTEIPSEIPSAAQASAIPVQASGNPAPLNRSQLASYQPAGQFLAGRQASGTLQVVYPHPDKKAGFAQAKLTLDAAPGAQTKPADWRRFIPWPQAGATAPEIYTLDIPRTELDQVVGKLQRTGYFEKTAPTQADAVLATKIDGGSVHRSWDRVPELDLLAAKLIASRPPAHPIAAAAPAGPPLPLPNNPWGGSMASDQRAPPVARLPNAGPTWK